MALTDFSTKRLPRKKLMRRLAARRPLGRRPIRRRARKTNVSEYASCSVTRTLAPKQGLVFNTNTMYETHDVQLADYARANDIADSYQFYRIKHVKMTFKFPYDTFAQGLGANASRPNFYYMLDKAQALPANPTLETLKQCGARPRACDNTPISIHWSPTVLTVDEGAGLLPSQYKTSPWLSTDTNNVYHNGVFWFLEQQFGGPFNYLIDIEVQFEFKKPRWIVQPSAPAAIGIKPAVEDASPDGIVGGPDGILPPA